MRDNSDDCWIELILEAAQESKKPCRRTLEVWEAPAILKGSVSPQKETLTIKLNTFSA